MHNCAYTAAITVANTFAHAKILNALLQHRESEGQYCICARSLVPQDSCMQVYQQGSFPTSFDNSAYLEDIWLVAGNVGDGYDDVAQEVDQYYRSKEDPDTTSAKPLDHEYSDDNSARYAHNCTCSALPT